MTKQLFYCQLNSLFDYRVFSICIKSLLQAMCVRSTVVATNWIQYSVFHFRLNQNIDYKLFATQNADNVYFEHRKLCLKLELFFFSKKNANSHLNYELTWTLNFNKSSKFWIAIQETCLANIDCTSRWDTLQTENLFKTP